MLAASDDAMTLEMPLDVFWSSKQKVMAVPSRMVIYLFLLVLESVIRSAGQLMGVMLSERSSARSLA
jgi:hypothetical protein